MFKLIVRRTCGYCDIIDHPLPDVKASPVHNTRRFPAVPKKSPKPFQKPKKAQKTKKALTAQNYSKSSILKEFDRTGEPGNPKPLPRPPESPKLQTLPKTVKKPKSPKTLPKPQNYS
jgi:hypothetical protein